MLKKLKTLSNVVFKPIELGIPPIHLQLEITDRCNQKCQMCSRDRLIDEPKAMPFETFKEIYDQINPQNINISGLGEPFANKDIFKISSYAKKNGSAVNLATNFTLAHRHLDEIMGSGIDQLKISIDAATKETYFKIRGMDKFEDIIEAIKELNSFKSKTNVSIPEIRFNFALQSQNIDEVGSVIHLAHELDVPAVYFQYLEYIDMEDRKEKLVDGLNVQSLQEKLHHAAKEALNKKIASNLHVWLRDLDLYANKMEALERFVPNKRACSFPWFSTFVEVNGDVKPCPIFVWKRNEGKMGNVLEDDFSTIWNNSTYKELRRVFKNRQRPYTPCETCIPQKIANIFYVSSRMLPKRKRGQ